MAFKPPTRTWTTPKKKPAPAKWSPTGGQGSARRVEQTPAHQMQMAVSRGIKDLRSQYPGQEFQAYRSVAKSNVDDYLRGAAPAAAAPQLGGSGGSGGGRGYGGGGYGGGGGGGGGGPDPAALAQGQMDYLVKLLGSDAFRTAPKQDALRQSINQATAADQASAQNAYGALDTWLQQNQTNPYQNVQLRQARFAPAQNAYLASQGVGPMNDVQANPEDVGAGNAFQNVLSLLGAGQQASQQSRLAESQMGRTFAGQQIGAMDNAMLAAVAQREADAQANLDNQRRQALMQFAGLIGQGAQAPDLPSMGIYAPGGNAQDPLGWAKIAADLAAQGR